MSDPPKSASPVEKTSSVYKDVFSKRALNAMQAEYAEQDGKVSTEDVREFGSLLYSSILEFVHNENDYLRIGMLLWMLEYSKAKPESGFDTVEQHIAKDVLGLVKLELGDDSDWAKAFQPLAARYWSTYNDNNEPVTLAKLEAELASASKSVPTRNPNNFETSEFLVKNGLCSLKGEYSPQQIPVKVMGIRIKDRRLAFECPFYDCLLQQTDTPEGLLHHIKSAHPRPSITSSVESINLEQKKYKACIGEEVIVWRLTRPKSQSRDQSSISEIGGWLAEMALSM